MNQERIFHRAPNRSVVFSSQKMDWKTPQAVYQILDSEFNFDFDPCPPNPQFDGLAIEWGCSNFCNPPYGTQIKHWIKKGFLEASKGKAVVFLIPSRTDTEWWHEYIMRADEIRFIRGRLKFQGAINSAPFPSCIVIYRSKS
jgi:hypothetical protein